MIQLWRQCLTRLLQFVAASKGVNYPPPSDMSGSVPARDEIPVIIVCTFSVVPATDVSDTYNICKFKMADGNRK